MVVWSYFWSCCSAKRHLILVLGKSARHWGHSWTLSIHPEQRIWPFSHWYNGPALGVSKHTGHSKDLLKSETEIAASASIFKFQIVGSCLLQDFVNITNNQCCVNGIWKPVGRYLHNLIETFNVPTQRWILITLQFVMTTDHAVATTRNMHSTTPTTYGRQMGT